MRIERLRHRSRCEPPGKRNVPQMQPRMFQNFGRSVSHEAQFYFIIEDLLTGKTFDFL